MQGLIYTGGFGNLRDYRSAGITPISITRNIPTWAQPMEYWPWLDFEGGAVVNKYRLADRINRWITEKVVNTSIVLINFEPNDNPKFRFMAKSMLEIYSDYKVVGEWSVAKKAIVNK